MNNRYIIKCITLKDIKLDRVNDNIINANTEMWYNPEASTFWIGGSLYDLGKIFYPSMQFPRAYFPITKIQNNAKIFKKLRTAQEHAKNVENSGLFKCEIYKLVMTLEKV